MSMTLEQLLQGLCPCWNSMQAESTSQGLAACSLGKHHGDQLQPACAAARGQTLWHARTESTDIFRG